MYIMRVEVGLPSLGDHDLHRVSILDTTTGNEGYNKLDVDYDELVKYVYEKACQHLVDAIYVENVGAGVSVRDQLVKLSVPYDRFFNKIYPLWRTRL